MENTNTYEIRKGIDGDILVKISNDGIQSFVPMVNDNSDYLAYLESLNDNTETE